MKNILVIGFFFLTVLTFSQSGGNIKGVVIDQSMNNEPLLMANVQLKGSDRVIQTNFHGNFEISDIQTGVHTLIISFLGYETEKVNVVVVENETTLIETNLSPMQINFDDVVGMNTISEEDESLTEKNTKE